MNNNELFGTYEGFLKGNLFKNLYAPYKNYVPDRLIPNNEKEEALLNLSQIGFAIHELNLYLDVFPDDNEMLEKFVRVSRDYNRLLNEYEEKYEVITINSEHLNTVPFKWVEQDWPWEVI